jgi:hypothetical protein
LPDRRPLLKKAFGFGIAVVMPFLMGSAFLTSRSTPDPAPLAIEAPAPPVVAPPAEDDDDVTSIDLLGNPVSDAVAKYKFDATGSLYELHSPQTELPKLAPPRS